MGWHSWEWSGFSTLLWNQAVDVGVCVCTTPRTEAAAAWGHPRRVGEVHDLLEGKSLRLIRLQKYNLCIWLLQVAMAHAYLQGSLSPNVQKRQRLNDQADCGRQKYNLLAFEIAGRR
jgi:hypothetical protein